MRCHEEALEKEAVAIGIGTEFAAEARCRQVISRCVDQISLAGNVTACRGNAAARIFDEGTGNDIGTGFKRFFFGSKFAVAIVDEANSLGAHALYSRRNLADIVNREGRTGAVATGALDQNHFRLLFLARRADAVQIVGVSLEGHFFITDALFLEGTRRFPGIANDALHRIVRCANE